MGQQTLTSPLLCITDKRNNIFRHQVHLTFLSYGTYYKNIIAFVVLKYFHWSLSYDNNIILLLICQPVLQMACVRLQKGRLAKKLRDI